MPFMVQPGSQEAGMVPPSIIDNHAHGAPPSPMPEEAIDEDEKAKGIECLRLPHHHLTIADSHRPKDPDIPACRSMKHNGIDVLRRNPHRTSRPILLEVAFVFKPKVNVVPSG